MTYACCGGDEDVVQLLLEASAFVEEQNENGHTPLMEAASGGHIGKGVFDNITAWYKELKDMCDTLECVLNSV